MSDFTTPVPVAELIKLEDLGLENPGPADPPQQNLQLSAPQVTLRKDLLEVVEELKKEVWELKESKGKPDTPVKADCNSNSFGGLASGEVTHVAPHTVRHEPRLFILSGHQDRLNKTDVEEWCEEALYTCNAPPGRTEHRNSEKLV